MAGRFVLLFGIWSSGRPLCLYSNSCCFIIMAAQIDCPLNKWDDFIVFSSCRSWNFLFFMGKDLLEAIELLVYYLLPALFLVNVALGYQHAVTKCLLLLLMPILIVACKTTECIYSDRGGFTLIKVDSNTVFIEKMYPIGGLVILPFFWKKKREIA